MYTVFKSLVYNMDMSCIYIYIQARDVISALKRIKLNVYIWFLKFIYVHIYSVSL